ncbi:Ankyrin repeat family protein [Zea mays]|uniref:Ankyrin repeat family protein n=1 Tax=Zea mays TaxID=4577 RepID=A0A1D6HCG2_MAIZE|nr:Ankyrin repeat family protein [Zea mays]
MVARRVLVHTFSPRSTLLLLLQFLARPCIV